MNESGSGFYFFRSRLMVHKPTDRKEDAMGNKELMKNMIELHKKSFDNFFSSLLLYQNQAEKSFKNAIETMPGISDEGRKIIVQWNEIYKKGIEDFKKAVDDGYAKVESLMDLDAMFSYQDQTEKMFDAFFGQKHLVPQNYFRDAMNMWVDAYKKNLKTIEEFLSSSSKKTKR